MEQKIPEELKSKNNKICIIGLVTDHEILADVRSGIIRTFAGPDNLQKG